MITRIVLLAVWFLTWMLLAWPPDRATMVLGVPVAVLVWFLTKDFFPCKTSSKNPLRYLWFIPYAAVFAWECVKANLDVAYRVIHPNVPINPGTVKVHTDLKSDMGLTLLGNSLSLTPGNTTVDIDKEKGIIYVHRLFISERRLKGDDVVGLAVAEQFENILRRIFE